MAENFYVNTVGAVPANKLSEAVSLGVTLAEEFMPLVQHAPALARL